jgi:hypothetical protein
LGGWEEKGECMKSIEIDIETRSDKDIGKCGVYAYTDSEYFEIFKIYDKNGVKE